MHEQEIRQLAAEIRCRVAEYKGAHPNATRRLVRIRRPDFSLQYRDDADAGINNFQPERIEEDSWEWRDQESFQESVVKSLAQYKALESALTCESRTLERFAQGICFASFQGINDGEMDARVNAFGREIEGKPLPVTVTAFIDGLSLDESPLKVSDRLSLRRPMREDVTEYPVLDEHGASSFPLGSASFRVIGEFVFDAVSVGPAQREFLRTLEAFRLFRLGGVSTGRYRMRSMHSFPGGVMTSGGGGRCSRYNYVLAASDCAPLSAFLRDLVPVLPDPLHAEKLKSEPEIAYARYRDALFQGGLAEQEITSAITALEALFLRGEPELTHRLAQRVSVFLRVLGTQTDATSTYKTVAKGYKIRSKFIHGESLKPEDRPTADSLARSLLGYARESVLAVFQLTTKKDELTTRLDRAMIDPAGESDLAASVAPVVHR